MRFLLDTHVLLWLAFEPDRVSDRVLSLVTDRSNTLWVSLATIWELVIKAKKGGLPDVPSDTVASFVQQQRRALGFRTLSITEAHIMRTLDLPLHHRDPFDRILVAQAQTEDLVLVSSDAKIRSYPVMTRW